LNAIAALAKQATDHALRMERPDQSWLLTTPTEWDFRRVSETELKTAIGYEYLREDAGFRQRTCSWLDARPLNKGKTMRERLLALSAPDWVAAYEGTNMERESVWERMFPHPCNLTRQERLLVLKLPVFPLPWLALDPQARADLSRNTGLQYAEPRALLAGQIGADCPKLPAQFYWLHANFEGRSVSAIVDAFRTWAQAERDRLVSAGEAARFDGKASAPAWHRLKELAAYRLDRGGLKHQLTKLAYAAGGIDAPRFLAAHLRKTKTDHVTDVLPIFDSRSAWWKATQSAARRIGFG